MKAYLLPLICGSCILLMGGGFSAKRNSTFLPPGTVRIADTLFMDKSEVTNLSWHEYLYWLKNMYGKDSQQYRDALPDTTVWQFDGINSNQPWQSSFSNVRHFKNHPICGISYEQAVAFCKWRTDRVRYFLNLKKEPCAFDFYYRLPTREEWEFAANGSGEVYAQLTPPKVVQSTATSTVIQVSWPANLRYNQSGDYLHTISVNSYKPNLFGIFDMTGNVAEMLKERGQCKGGSFYHSPEASRNGKTLTYQEPAAWLGFRCVCVVYHKK
jgi:formylglycine-generating enzyme required for sulfatase activity